MRTSNDHASVQHFEQTLAFHCAPAMAGIKAADLFSWPGPAPDALSLIDFFSSGLARTGICLRPLYTAPVRNLILVYRPDCLTAQLARTDVRTLLLRDGYPVEQGLDAMLDSLASRIAQSGDFPHEIGLFLGYPTEDVEGFRQNAGRGFKCSGLWKVYSDVDRAQECFRRYHCCRRALCRRVRSGCPLTQVFRVS